MAESFMIGVGGALRCDSTVGAATTFKRLNDLARSLCTCTLTILALLSLRHSIAPRLKSRVAINKSRIPLSGHAANGKETLR
jgi:hypothetical protein